MDTVSLVHTWTWERNSRCKMPQEESSQRVKWKEDLESSTLQSEMQFASILKCRAGKATPFIQLKDPRSGEKRRGTEIVNGNGVPSLAVG